MKSQSWIHVWSCQHHSSFADTLKKILCTNTAGVQLYKLHDHTWRPIKNSCRIWELLIWKWLKWEELGIEETRQDSNDLLMQSLDLSEGIFPAPTGKYQCNCTCSNSSPILHTILATCIQKRLAKTWGKRKTSMLTTGMGSLSFKGVERLIRGKGIFKCNP